MKQRAEPAAGVLYVVGTPIGNLGDLSPRAHALLIDVDTIACEDTRHSGQLLSRMGSTARRCSFHQHNTRTRIPQLLMALEDGRSVAVISDAGLPGISDPGQELVAAARSSGFEVVCIPGPCAATTALVSSGLPTDRFCFEGFLPAKGRQRQDRLALIACEQRTSVIYEAPHRLCQLLEELTDLCGDDRPLQVARELTKRHEQQVGPTVAAARIFFQQHSPQGECTLVLGGAAPLKLEALTDTQCCDQMLELTMEGMSASDAAKTLARRLGRSKRELYALFHAASQQADCRQTE